MRTLPLDSEHARLGARFGDVAGWRIPLEYADAAAEQRAVRTGAGVIDWSARGVIRVTGPDRLSFLDGLLTNDLKTLGPGHGVYAATLDHKGRVHGDMIVYDLGDQYLLATEPEAGDRVLAHLTKLLVSDDVTLEDVSTKWVVLGLFGPQSGAISESVFGARPPAAEYEHAVHTFGEGSVRLARNPYFGGEGFEVWVPPAFASSVFRGLVDAGSVPFGHSAAEALRIEAGRPKYPLDMDEDTLVLEARLDRAISMTKGCYVGQEIVSRATYIGQVNRVLVGLAVDGTTPPNRGEKVLADGKVVGRVTSAAWSANAGRILALGYVRREVSEPGTRVAIDGARDVPATVAALPFVR